MSSEQSLPNGGRQPAAPTARSIALLMMTLVMVLTMSTWFSESTLIPQLVDR